jgi:hypothetical protein
MVDLPPNWGMARGQAATVSIEVGEESKEVVDLPEAVARAAGEAGPAVPALSSVTVLPVPVPVGSMPAAEAPGAVIASPLDPLWANVNQWNDAILAAQQQALTECGEFVPTNVIKAVMMIETGGIMPSGPNYAGAHGLMQFTPDCM